VVDVGTVGYTSVGGRSGSCFSGFVIDPGNARWDVIVCEIPYCRRHVMANAISEIWNWE
jgi:hypothetical protein